MGVFKRVESCRCYIEPSTYLVFVGTKILSEEYLGISSLHSRYLVKMFWKVVTLQLLGTFTCQNGAKRS